MGFAAYLLDIEGTTTPVDFVTRTLFPYARARMEAFLATADFAADSEMASVLATLELEHAEDVRVGNDRPSLDVASDGRNPPSHGGGGVAGTNPPSRYLPYLHWLMDQDRKSPGLKSIQGRIWEGGYRSGELRGDLYPDVVPAIRRWRDSSARVYIYSSGSVLAQRLLFGHSVAGDLTPLLDGFFDTGIGVKVEASSYRAIAAEVGLEPSTILFLSDSEKEIVAARQARMSACEVRREGGAEGFPESVGTFDEVP